MIKIDQDSYDGVVVKLNPQIEQLIIKCNELQSEKTNTIVNVAELKSVPPTIT